MKKILSIDGGGIRGLIPALVLAEVEKKTGKPISKRAGMPCVRASEMNNAWKSVQFP